MPDRRQRVEQPAVAVALAELLGPQRGQRLRKAGETAEYRFADKERYGYLVPAKGKIEVNGVALDARDGAAIQGEDTIRVTASEDAELILVDVAA